MGRFYTVNSGSFSTTDAVARDLLELKAGTGKPFVLHELTISQGSEVGSADAENLVIHLKRATGSYTAGSGGSAATAVAHSSTEAAAGLATKNYNNTTQAAVGTGTLDTIRTEMFPVEAGYEKVWTPETRYVFQSAEAFILSLEAFDDVITEMAISAVIEEL